VIITSSAMFQMPREPDHAPMRHRWPMTVLPEIPVQAAIAVCAPMIHVVAHLDLIIQLGAMLDHRIADRAAIDGRIRPDLDIVPDAHAADCGTLNQVPRSVQSRSRPPR